MTSEERLASGSTYASFGARALEFVIDFALLFVVQGAAGFIIGSAVGGVIGASGGSDEQIVTAVRWIVTPIALLINCLYYTLLESSPWQATLGKKFLGLRVTDLHDEPIGFGRANARYWAKYLSAATLGTGFLVALFTRRRQALHDIIASTVVVSRRNATRESNAMSR